VADGWLSTLLGYHRIKNAVDTLFAQRSTLKFLGATITDDPTNKQTVVDITAGVNGTITVRKNSGANVGTRGRINLIEGTGVGLTVADDAGNSEVDVTIASTQTLQQAYANGGTVDAVVASGTNNLLVRAAGNVTDILARWRRNATGAAGEQTLLKAPDAIANSADGTQLHVQSGAGFAGTGASAGSHAGAVVITGAAGGGSVDGASGGGAALSATGGTGGTATGTGNAGSGGSLSVLGGTGGPANNGAAGGGGALTIKGGPGNVASGASGSAGTSGATTITGGDGLDGATDRDGAHGGALTLLGGSGGDALGTGMAGDAAGVRIDAGVIGAGAEENGSLNGTPANVYIGDVNAPLVVIGRDDAENVIRLRARVSVGGDADAGDRLAVDIPRIGGSPPSGAIGQPQYTTTERDALNTPNPANGALIWNTTKARAEIWNGSKWIAHSQVAALAVAFSGTPTFDLSASQDFALGQITSNFAMTFSNPAAGQRGRIFMVQDGTGNRLITGITVAGFTVLMDMEAEASVNTTQFKVASARSVLEYKLDVVDAVNVCFVRVLGAKTAAFG
jgi:hypothetical protein